MLIYWSFDIVFFFFFSSRRRHTRWNCDWSSDVSLPISIRAAGCAIANVDSVLILSAPRIGPHAADIRSKVAELLDVPVECVALKATTPEGTGTESDAIALVVVILEKKTTGLSA